MQRLWSVFLFIVLHIGSWNLAHAITCPPLTKHIGVRLDCQDPETGQSISCKDDMPVGTTVYYECAKHYISPFGGTDGGRMTCLNTGKWGRSIQYAGFICSLDCGKPTAAVGGKSPVIVFGEVAARENFPWHAAIFRSDGTGTRFNYFCGGSLINPSNKGFLILTAAHCVTSKLRTFRIRPLEDFRVVLGSVSSDITYNEMTNGTEFFTVKAAKIHPNYNYDNIQNDVAIMKLHEKIKISNYVSPVCFPSQDMANMQIQGEGMIAGYGVDQNTKVSAILNFARLPVTDNSVCNRALGKEMTSVEFCAGYERGSSICSGDSGGGLIFSDDASKRVYVQGIASNVDRRPLQDLKYCQNYNTFTRVSSFVDWVQDQLDEFFADDYAEEEEEINSEVAIKRPPSKLATDYEEFIVTVYKNINDMDTYVEWRMKGCSSVPNNWNEGMFWIDIHGKCLQFFEGTYCSGKSLQLQSTPESSLFKWNFPDFKIKSVSLCPKKPGNGNPKPTQRPTTTPKPHPPNNPNGGGQEVSLEDGNDYEKVGMQRHNLYRTKHGVPAISINDNLSIGAKNYADQLIKRTGLQPSGVGGENLFEIFGSTQTSAAIVQQAVDLWYNTIEQYNWNSPSATSFSQLVWKSSREIGIGVAKSGRRTVVVARYAPPGNIYYGGSDRTKYFRENVFPARK